jgi:hypothetical protein
MRSCEHGIQTQTLARHRGRKRSFKVCVEPFSVAADAAVIDDMQVRIRAARLPEAAPPGCRRPRRPAVGAGHRDWLEELLSYWAGGFDWRAAERELNRFRALPGAYR